MLIARTDVPSWMIGRVKPKLTRRGLVAVAIDEYLSQCTVAHVVVIGDRQIETAIHAVKGLVNELTPKTERAPEDDRYVASNIGEGQYEIGGLSFDWSARLSYVSELTPEERRLVRISDIVRYVLHHVTNAGSAYDALHSTIPKIYPTLENGGRLPYAGMQYGARINLERMLNAGVAFHPAVLEAVDQLRR